MIDIEADYWKDIFVHLLHKNMVRIDAKPLSASNALPVFQKFTCAHPDCCPEITTTESYVTWELFITPTIKFRLFIQNQIKASLLQKTGNELVKICDAKFPYDPFPEISEFLENKNQYLVELEHKKEEYAKTQKQLSITNEFVKANLKKLFNDKDKVLWQTEIQEKNIKLRLDRNGKSEEFILTPENYLDQLKNCKILS